MASTKFTHNDYTVGWVCALPKEQIAALAMLDCEHPPLLKQPSDKNAYTLGEVQGHNVVIACLPKGMYGTNSAAIVAARMLDTFPSIKFGLMVGIGGGIPPRVRLGDVVVSTPIKQYPGVVQWDFGESLKGRHSKKIGVLNNPPTELLTALSNLESKRTMTGYKIPQYLDELAYKYPKLVPKYIKSDSLEDPLDSPAGVQYDRVGLLAFLLTLWRMIVSLFKLFSGWQTFPSSISGDGESHGQQREMQVHYGLIASGNRLIKDSVLRDNINLQMDRHVLCVEMEAAGLANEFPCLVIRGICDYADSEKNKDWQEHAATVAAAFAKDLLSEVQVTEVSQMSNAKIFLEMKAGLDDVSEKVTHLHSARITQDHRDILEWISPIDYSSVQNDTLRRRQPGTCQWLIDSKQYQAWLKTSKQTLFCPGIPGAGKTIATSVVVNDLMERFCNHNNVGVAFIYCNYRYQDDQKIDKILASILRQLAEKQAFFAKVVQDLYDRHKPRKTRPLVDELSEALQSIVKTYDRVYIIVDALDECDTSGGTRSQLLKQLMNLKKNSDVNLFMTSRYMPDVEEKLQGDIVKLKIRASEEDVGSYLDSRLASLSELVKKNKDLRDDIRAKVIQAVDGMFLLAELHVGSLEGMFLPNQIRDALKTLPTGTTAYDETYKGAMDRIESRANTKAFAKTVLAWITCARRPLRTSEFRHALAVQFGNTDLDERNLPVIGDVVAVCAGLVAVDKESKIIRLAHYTTKQYFERTKGTWFPNAEEDITIACVTYLSSKSFKGEPTELWHNVQETFQSDGFYNYVATNWGHHGHASQSKSRELIEFLQSDQPVKAAANVLMATARDLKLPISYKKDRERRRYDSFIWRQPHYNLIERMEGIHLAAYFGITEAVSALLRHGNEADVEDTLLRTPLIWSAINDHENTVKVLLENGADANSKDISHRTPLSMAAEEGHESIVRQLLAKKRTNADSEDDKGKSPLHYATQEGHTDILNLFLATEGINVNPNDRSNRTPLSIASEKGYTSIVGLLLANDEVDADSRDYQGRSPLHHAARKGHTTVIDILLSTGKVDVNAESRMHETPGSVAVQSGNVEIFERLLRDSKFYVNYANNDGETLLFQAVTERHENVVKLLLDSGKTQVDSRDRFGRTPLSEATRLEFVAIAKLLVDIGKADINATISRKTTPLRIAVLSGNERLVRVLLESGQIIQFGTEHPTFDEALMKAIHLKMEGMVRLLLARGKGQISVEDNAGYTPLSYAAFQGLESIVRLLLESGLVYVDARDRHGKTPLQWAASLWRKPIVWLLLEHGAGVDEAIRASMKPLSESSGDDIRIVMYAAMKRQ